MFLGDSTEVDVEVSWYAYLLVHILQGPEMPHKSLV